MSKAFIRNIAEVEWKEFPGHHGGALSKPLVAADTSGTATECRSRFIMCWKARG